MSIVTRPTDVITEDHLLIGMPFIEFGRALTGGGYEAYRSLGIIDSAEIAKTLELVELTSSHSGVQVLVRELVRRLDSTINAGVFNFDQYNMQLMFGSSSLTAVAAATPTITDEPFRLTNDPLDYISLAHQNMTSVTAVSAAEIADEAVGTGAGGTFGETLGDFALDYKVFVIGDVTAYTEGGVDRSGDLVAGGTPGAGEIGITVGTSADSGKIIYPSGEAPTLGDAIVSTYEPSFTMIKGDLAAQADLDYYEDLKSGRIRVYFEDPAAATDSFRAQQPMESTYVYTEPGHDEIVPFTQNVFAGRCRVRHLPDVGINIIWNIPSVSVRLTDDAFTWNRDEFTVGTLAVRLLHDGTSTPYGTIEIYDETP